MNRDDFALICPACGCVTIFQDDASHPRRCARCDDVLRRGGARARGRIEERLSGALGPETSMLGQVT